MKKLVALLLAIACVLGCLAGCAGSDVTVTTATEAKPAETTTTEPAKEDVAAGLEAVTVAEVDVDVEAMTYTESPVLTEKVAKGEIPALEDRIPDKDNVFVETVAYDGTALEIGKFGGILRQPRTKTGDWDVCRGTSLERPVDFYKDGSSFLNVLKSLTPNEDCTEWTMELRKGMKWSDGEDFNADDITFWYYMTHINNYDNVGYWTAFFQYAEDGTTKEYAELEKIDDYTLVWKFKNPQYASNFTDTGDLKFMWCPQHFYADKVPSSFYIENPYWPDPQLSDEDVLANFLKVGMDFTTMKECGNTVYKPWKWYQIPAISAWIVSPEEGFNNVDCSIMKFVRNPYYWKVDAAGQQLPYLDEMWFIKVTDLDQGVLMLESGDADFICLGNGNTGSNLADVTAVQDAMGDNVVIKKLKSTCWGYNQFAFNLTHKDPKMNALLNNYSFRKAFSICVDRNEIVNLWFDGLTEPTNAAPQYPNFGYSEEWAYQNTEYNVEEAKRLLAEDCGLVMGSDGFFDYPDGSDLEFTLIGKGTTTEEAEQIAALQPYWKAAGLKINLVQTEDYNTIFDSNEGWDIGNCNDMLNGYKVESRPKQFVPLNLAATWYSFYDIEGKAKGEQYHDPSENPEIQKLCDLYREWLTIPELKDRDELDLAMMEVLIRNQWVVAYSSDPDQYYMVTNKYINWPDEMLNEDKFNYMMMFKWWTISEK